MNMLIDRRLSIYHIGVKITIFFLMFKKIKIEVIFDFRKKCSPVDPVYVENEHVEIVEKYKYLGTYQE